jgi:hypothetical protein
MALLGDVTEPPRPSRSLLINFVARFGATGRAEHPREIRASRLTHVEGGFILGAGFFRGHHVLGNDRAKFLNLGMEIFCGRHFLSDVGLNFPNLGESRFLGSDDPGAGGPNFLNLGFEIFYGCFDIWDVGFKFLDVKEGIFCGRNVLN